jgi:hypothetical protein
MTLDGTWKLEGITGQGRRYNFVYKFINNNFSQIDNITGKELCGTFVLDEKTISFKILHPEDAWVQEYNLTDKHLDLKREKQSHISGKFFYQS